MNAQQLKNSILQMAVQGKLVAQDPTDEPASVLIERIRAEKEQLIKDKKIKKEKNPSFIYRAADNLHYENIGGEVRCIANEVPFEIPESWEWVRLGSILTKLTDGAHHTPKYTTSGIPFISVKDMSSGVISFDNTKFISHEEHQELFKRCNPVKGDIILSKVGTTGIPVLVKTDKEFSLFVSVALLKFNHEHIDAEYLVKIIQSPLVQLQCTENTRGVGNKNWVMRDIANTLICVPPLNEQIRIVNKVNKTLPHIEKYNTAHTKIEKLNKDFPEKLKKSILQWAVQGKLVPQDPNDEPASVLLECIRAEKAQLIKDKKIKKDKQESIIYKKDNSHYEKIGNIERCIDDEIPFDIPESWEWERLINIFNFIDYRGKTPTKLTSGIPLLTAKNIKKGYIDYKIQDFISQQEYLSRQTRGLSKIGDILFTTEAPLGNIAVANLLEYSAGQRLITFQQYTCDSNFSNEFFMYCMLSDEFQKMLALKSTGTTVKGIKADKLKGILVPFPPLTEQQRIVNKIEELLKLNEKL